MGDFGVLVRSENVLIGKDNNIYHYNDTFTQESKN